MNRMKKHLILSLLTAVMLFVSGNLMAQTVVRGQIIDAETQEPLIGASVFEEGTQAGTVTDMDGNFSLKISKGKAITLKYIGYDDQSVKVNAKSGNVNLGQITMKSNSVNLKDVVVTSSMAIARKTPVAVSQIGVSVIEDKLGTQEFPEVLKSTPGVHANKQGGGYGDSEIYMRGFDNTNVATMINGVPMNDMENGNLYWSNWAGLSDVTRIMQTQRGLGASKVSAPSVGGTINIITNGLEAKRGGAASYQIGSNGMSKTLFTVSSGMSKKGWAFTVLGARVQGDGNAQGLNYEGYNYFVNIAKRINDAHQLSFTAFGAPQKHFQRSSSSALTLANWALVEKKYGVKNYRYNATYGVDANGKQYSEDYNVYHKPQISLNHQWLINSKSNLSTSAYLSIGRGYGYAGEANDADYSDVSYKTLRGANYGALNMTYRNADGTFDYATIKANNAAGEYGSKVAMTKSLNYHTWYGLLSTYTTKLTKDIDFYGGIDFRAYKGTHKNEIVDLMGGDYILDPDRRDVLPANNANANNQAWVYKKLGVGDIMYRDYDSHVIQEGGFFQAEYNRNKLAAFVSGSLSNTTYWRYGRFYYDKDHARSKTVNYMGFTVKGGANYNINEYHNVFVNVGVISRAPKFAYGAFMTSTTSNVTNPNAKNEKIYSAEAGYGFKSAWLTANLNVYYTLWRDKAMTKTGTLTNKETGKETDYYMNMTGVGARHMGVELELKSEPLTWLSLNGMLSIGNWEWDNNATGYAYNDAGQPLTSNGGVASGVMADDHAWATINLDGIKVGGSAQTTAALGAQVKFSKYLKAGIDWTYLGRAYAYYSFSGNNLSLGKAVNVLAPWEIPAASHFDMNASYRFKIGDLNATLSGNVNNLFNYHYIVKAWNPNTLSSASLTEATADNISCFIHTGRTYSIRLKVNF